MNLDEAEGQPAANVSNFDLPDCLDRNNNGDGDTPETACGCEQLPERPADRQHDCVVAQD